MRSLLFLLISVIFSFGVVMIYSTTSAEVLDLELHRSKDQAIFKQLLFGALGTLGAFGVYRFGYRRFLLWSPFLFFFLTSLLLFTLVPGIGKVVNGSRRWLSILGVSFQPSEFAKYIIPAFFICCCNRVKREPFTFFEFFRMLCPIAISLGLILVAPDNGTVVVLVVSLIVLFFLIGVPVKYWAIPLLVLSLIGAAFALQLPYVSKRLQVYLNPQLDLLGRGHQPHQAKIAAGSGKLFGKGPGNSWQKLSYLPEAQNDYIAAIFAEEFGFFGMALLIFLYMLLALLGFSIAFRAQEPEGLCLAAVITFLISFQTFLNLGVVSGLLPSTGLNLPFFSQGGSSLVANLMGVGLLQSIGDAKNEKTVRDSCRGGNRRTLLSSASACAGT